MVVPSLLVLPVEGEALVCLKCEWEWEANGVVWPLWVCTVPAHPPPTPHTHTPM